MSRGLIGLCPNVSIETRTFLIVADEVLRTPIRCSSTIFGIRLPFASLPCLRFQNCSPGLFKSKTISSGDTPLAGTVVVGRVRYFSQSTVATKATHRTASRLSTPTNIARPGSCRDQMSKPDMSPRPALTIRESHAREMCADSHPRATSRICARIHSPGVLRICASRNF